MEKYKTAESIASKQSDLDNFLQQLDFKISRLSQVKERLESKVEKMYGGVPQEVLKTDSPESPKFIPTSDTLKYKLQWLEAVIEDVSNLTTKIEEFI